MLLIVYPREPPLVRFCYSQIKCNHYSKTIGLLNQGESNSTVWSKCSNEIDIITLIIIRQQTMTKKMLVKTESVDMTWGGGVGGQMGEERESWCKETDVNECFHKKQNFFFFPKVFNLVKRNSHPTHRHSHIQTDRQTSWKTPKIPCRDISGETEGISRKEFVGNSWFSNCFSPSLSPESITDATKELTLCRAAET